MIYPRIRGGNSIEFLDCEVLFGNNNSPQRGVEVEITQFLGIGVHFYVTISEQTNYFISPNGDIVECWDHPKELLGRKFGDDVKFDTLENAIKFAISICDRFFKDDCLYEIVGRGGKPLEEYFSDLRKVYLGGVFVYSKDGD